MAGPFPYDNVTGEAGVAHEDVANTDHTDATTLIQGYDYQDFSEIAPDPVACWPLHENSGSTAYDLAGTNDGTVNGATQGVAGPLGTSAYSFDGSDDLIAISDPNPLSAYTVMAWAYSTSSSKKFQSIYDTRTPDNSFQFRAEFSNWVLVQDDNGTFKKAEGGTTGQSDWRFIVGTWDGSTLRLYENATLIGSASASGAGSKSGGTALGAKPENIENFVGDLAEVRLYDQALSQSQIQTLYDVVAKSGDWLSTGQTL